MSLKNRIRTVERQMNITNSGYCRCEREIKTIVLVPTADGKGKTILGGGGEPYTETETETPEICQTCGKPHAEPLHITFTINPAVELTGEA